MTDTRGGGAPRPLPTAEGATAAAAGATRPATGTDTSRGPLLTTILCIQTADVTGAAAGSFCSAPTMCINISSRLLTVKITYFLLVCSLPPPPQCPAAMCSCFGSSRTFRYT